MIRHFNLVNRKVVPFKHEINLSGFDVFNPADIKPAAVKAFTKELSRANKKIRIRSSHINDVWISTAFLVLDHGHGGKPVLFETMIFDGGGSSKGYQVRATTHREALNNHREAVKTVKGK